MEEIGRNEQQLIKVGKLLQNKDISKKKIEKTNTIKRQVNREIKKDFRKVRENRY